METAVLMQVSSYESKFEEHDLLVGSATGGETGYRVFVMYGRGGQPWMVAVQAPDWTDVHTAEWAGLATHDVPHDWIDDHEDRSVVLALSALCISLRSRRIAPSGA